MDALRAFTPGVHKNWGRSLVSTRAGQSSLRGHVKYNENEKCALTGAGFCSPSITSELFPWIVFHLSTCQHYTRAVYIKEVGD